MSETRGEAACGHVLVVDDEVIVRQLLIGLLKGEGYSVEGAATGEEPLRALDRQLLDLVLSDLVEAMRLVAQLRRQAEGAVHSISGETPERRLIAQARQERWSIARLEREYILEVLHEAGGHRGRAADVLGIDRRTLYRKLKQYQAEGHFHEDILAPV